MVTRPGLSLIQNDHEMIMLYLKDRLYLCIEISMRKKNHCIDGLAECVVCLFVCACVCALWEGLYFFILWGKHCNSSPFYLLDFSAFF